MLTTTNTSAVSKSIWVPGSKTVLGEGDKTKTFMPSDLLTSLKDRKSLYLAIANGDTTKADKIEKKIEPLLTPLNVVSLKSGVRILDILGEQKKNWELVPVRLAISGNTKAPYEGYGADITVLLKSINDNLNSRFPSSAIDKKLGIVTSPSADKGSVDVGSTKAALEMEAPLMFPWALRYLQYVNGNGIPEELAGSDKLSRDFLAHPKFATATKEEFSQAFIDLSNAQLLIGGGNQSIVDLVNSIKQDKKAVVIVQEKDNKKLEFKEKTLEGKIALELSGGSASKYLQEQTNAYLNGELLPHPLVGNIEQILKPGNKEQVRNSIAFLNQKGNEQLADKASEVANSLLNFLKIHSF